ncbi:MAG: hypothetical protein QF578_24990 [Alphaproteobacteria bacterium]|jgi:hypothetical protein|nr:hypothetical protein [Alphaproteobacteria bacterium]MDP6568103.1 hypothetical protein [Alphaproteobacteria bacterium]MDP6813814.1 hypothetical protein [Alphaproteobacteria bacterium]
MSDIDKARLSEFFGREFSDGEIEAYGARLARQLTGLERLRQWEPELGLIEPAVVTRILRTAET